MTYPLIGLLGAKQSGKSTAAKHIVDHHGFTRIRFADPLKEILRVLGCTPAQIDGDEKEIPLERLCGKSPRNVMDLMGTECGRRMIGEELWVNIVDGRLRELLPRGPVVIDDVRFENEAALVRRLGGALWTIRRPSVEPVDLNAAYVTERLWAADDDTDATLWNLSTPGELFATVDHIMEVTHA